MFIYLFLFKHILAHSILKLSSLYIEFNGPQTEKNFKNYKKIK